MTLKILSTSIIATSLAFSIASANAEVTTDSHGNVGYDSYDECVSAVKSGQARYYTPYTYQKPKRWQGETSVKQGVLSEVTIPDNVAASMPLSTKTYSAGACDKGVGQSNGRYGVSTELVGKYVPFSSDMPINIYMNSAGKPVRMTMQQCDNHFGSRFPIPVVSEMKAPEAQLTIEESQSREVITTQVKRTIRHANYALEEVIVVPSDQVAFITTDKGTEVVVQDGVDSAVIMGMKVDEDILEDLQPTIDEVPVIVVPEVN